MCKCVLKHLNPTSIEALKLLVIVVVLYEFSLFPVTDYTGLHVSISSPGGLYDVGLIRHMECVDNLSSPCSLLVVEGKISAVTKLN